MLERKECKQCNYTWIPRVDGEPKQCPKCKSLRWMEAGKKVRKGK